MVKLSYAVWISRIFSCQFVKCTVNVFCPRFITLGFFLLYYEQSIFPHLELLLYFLIFVMTVHLVFATTFNLNACSHHVCVSGPSERRYRDDRAKLFLIVADGTMRKSNIKLQRGQFSSDTMEKKMS